MEHIISRPTDMVGGAPSLVVSQFGKSCHGPGSNIVAFSMLLLGLEYISLSLTLYL